ncbi:hypothetical protein BH24DEI2_BH24DEI2_18750 [soil metagenome]
MTKLLEQALLEVSRLSKEDQDAIAADILAKVKAKNPREVAGSLSGEPFFGIWQNREDLADGVAWVSELRKREWSY